MKLQNMLMLFMLCFVGGMQAAAELETEMETVAGKQVSVYNSRLMLYYFKISKNIRGVSTDPVVWDGVPSADGTVVIFPRCAHPIRVTIYDQKPSQVRRAHRVGYTYINPDEVERLKKLSLIVHSGFSFHDDYIGLEFNDGSTLRKILM
ncbi:MAG TPA: hypothetical protein PKD74_04045 [Candidatus Dependentiae bacterium]|nr:hypothetical protein [Candidatus Dependentiae bacterium]